jgi:hypothetical protein
MSKLRRSVVHFVKLWDGKEAGNVEKAIDALRQELEAERVEGRQRTRKSREKHHVDVNRPG